MFVLCPHCHFLVGLDPRTGAPPARCPKCDQPLGDARETAVEAETPVDVAPPSNAPGTAADTSAAPSASPGRVMPDASPSAAASPPDAAPPERESTPPRLDADAMIAAMAAKAPRRAGLARKKIESAKAMPAATPGIDTPSSNAPDPLTSIPRAQRGKRKSAPTPAQQPAPQAKTPADPQPQSQRPAASTWWTALLQAWRTRAAAMRAREDAKAASPAAPAFDPLAASVRNRARNRRLAGDSTPTAATAIGASAATPAVGAGVPALPTPAVASEPTHGTASAALPGLHTSPPIETTAVETTLAALPDVAPAQPSPLQAPGETPVAPTPTSTPVMETPPSTAEAQAAPAEAPFVERRRNPDVPVPPGTIPTHPLRRRTDAPSFARAQSASTGQRRGWRWPAAVAALSLLLVLQLLLAQRDTLAADARWRPTVSAMCTLLRCQLPPWREPGAFTMLSRDVRAHPSAPGALLINASFRNDARWSQPWPRVLLTLSNVDGRIVGARAFAAKEYLGADAAATQHELAPGQTAAITVAVVEPAPDIVAFSFDFR